MEKLVIYHPKEIHFIHCVQLCGNAVHELSQNEKYEYISIVAEIKLDNGEKLTRGLSVMPRPQSLKKGKRVSKV